MSCKTLRTKIQMVFQDPFSSLSPRMTVQNILSEPLEIHGRGNGRSQRKEMVEGLMQAVGLDPRFLQPLSAQLFRRPAPAHRHRARAGARPRSPDLRRAGLGARRLGAGADPQSAQGSAEGARAHLPVHLAQPGGRRLHGRPHRGDVPRPHRRARAARDAVPQAGPSLYARAARRRALSRSRPAARFQDAQARRRLRQQRLGQSSSATTATADATIAPISAAAIWCSPGVVRKFGSCANDHPRHCSCAARLDRCCRGRRAPATSSRTSSRTLLEAGKLPRSTQRLPQHPSRRQSSRRWAVSRANMAAPCAC